MKQGDGGEDNAPLLPLPPVLDRAVTLWLAWPHAARLLSRLERPDCWQRASRVTFRWHLVYPPRLIVNNNVTHDLAFVKSARCFRTNRLKMYLPFSDKVKES